MWWWSRIGPTSSRGWAGWLGEWPRFGGKRRSFKFDSSKLKVQKIGPPPPPSSLFALLNCLYFLDFSYLVLGLRHEGLTKLKKQVRSDRFCLFLTSIFDLKPSLTIAKKTYLLPQFTKLEMGPDPTDPGTFRLDTNQFFLTRWEKIFKIHVFRGNFQNSNPNHKWLTRPDPTQPGSKNFDPDPSLQTYNKLEMASLVGPFNKKMELQWCHTRNLLNFHLGLGFNPLKNTPF